MLYFITSLIAVLGVCWIHPRLVAIALDKTSWIIPMPGNSNASRSPFLAVSPCFRNGDRTGVRRYCLRLFGSVHRGGRHDDHALYRDAR